MANTYTQIYIHIVFTVQGRHNLLPKKHLEELYKYITGILQRREQKLLAIGGMPDHVHVFIGLNPSGRSFKEEYLDMLRKFAVAYDEQYLFDWVEEA